MMALKIEASFEDGIFVPAVRPALADRERVRITVERTSPPDAAGRSRGNQTARSATDWTVELDYHPDGC
jgi:Protein of unknown function DUF104